jgi:hypothetical protein
VDVVAVMVSAVVVVMASGVDRGTPFLPPHVIAGIPQRRQGAWAYNTAD